MPNGSLKEHKVPLCHCVLEILSTLPHEDGSRSSVFIGGAKGKPIDSMAMLDLLKEMRPGLTVHGFRSSFRDWSAERTNHPREIAEKALAHTIKNAGERAYQRSDLLEPRRRLMAEWERYCEQKPVTTKRDTVVPMRR